MKIESIVFMGSTDFSLKSLVTLYEAKFNIVAVYTRPPKPSGRNYKIQKSAVHNFAEEKNILVCHPQNFKSENDIEFFRSLAPELVVVSSYGLIIPKVLLDIPLYGFINIHASLLPRWRGASPIQSAILAGDKKTGITIMKMDEGLDTGDVISMKSVLIHPKTTYGHLANQLASLGSNMILEVLMNIEESLSKLTKQSEVESTYAKKITKDSCKINWDDFAENILRHIMAFSPIPAAWTEINGTRLKVLDAEIVGTNGISDPGFVSHGMVVACKNSSLKLTLIQPSGANQMSGDDFLRGRKIFTGEIAK